MKIKICKLLILGFLVMNISSLSGQSADRKARQFLAQQAESWGLQQADLSDLIISDMYTTDHNGLTHVYFQQQYKGIPIYNAVTSVHITKEGKVIESPNRFYGKLSSTVNATTARLSASDALLVAVQHLGVPNALVPTKISRTDDKAISYFPVTNFTNSEIPVRLMYFPMKDGSLRLVYDFSLDLNYTDQHPGIKVDARTGEVLHQNDYIVHCNFGSTSPGSCRQADHQHSSGVSQASPVVRPAAPNSYNVIAFPAESPLDGPRTIVVNPASPLASPYGWHDTNGSAGAENTVTRGNNVNAYLDRNGDNVNDGNQPDGGKDLIFDFPFDQSKEPPDYTKAAVTNLFYVNNMMHDILYGFGFDEKAGSFQVNNYGKGGQGNDAVNAEAQDGSGTNNANFLTLADGSPGRMQMFLWSSSGNETFITKPDNLASALNAIRGNFGPAPTTTPITGDVVWSEDKSPGKEKLGCSNTQNVAKLTGKIALIERGECEFGTKAFYAQNAGAIAVIICSHTDENIGMDGGVDGSKVSIPAYYITKKECDRIRVYVENGLVVTIKKPENNLAVPDSLDGDFDNGVICHEFGHGVSNRLTGGPSQAACLGNAEQMGEGWSDFMTLIMSANASRKGSDIRGIGNYVVGAKVDGTGIRRKPYSTDLNVNNFTYKNIDAEVHNLGEIWTLVLWDLYWALADKYGYDPDFKNKNAGNNICIQLVMDGMKLQPCIPGFIDGRNAILKADEVNNGGVNQCLIWDVFARRGFGYSANQGSSNLVGDEVEDLESAPLCVNQLKMNKKADYIVKAGQPINYELTLRNLRKDAANNVRVVDQIPAGCSYINGSASLAPSSVSGTEIVWEIANMASLQQIVIKYQVATPAGQNSNTFWIDPMNDDSSYDNWDIIINKGFLLWNFDSDGGIADSRCFSVPDTTIISDLYLELLTPVKLSGVEPSLLYQHYMNTESRADGGYLEITEDGKIWTRLKTNNFTLNTYNGELAYGTFSVPNLEGFSGYTGGFIPVVADLSPWNGKTVRVRFHYGSDDNTTGTGVGFRGWKVDEVEFINPVFYNGQACVTSGLGDNTCMTLSGKGTLVESNKTVGIDPEVTTKQLVAYPNPTSNQLYLKFAKENTANVTVRLLDLSGRTVFQNEFRELGKQTKIDIANLIPGLYTLEVKSKDINYRTKITKQ